MKASHIHIGVKALPEALEWLSTVWKVEPVFSNGRMAVISLGAFSVVLDQSEVDGEAVIAFESDDCKRDFDEAIRRGAEALEAPEAKNWGVKVAYLKGPGRLTFEIEEALG